MSATITRVMQTVMQTNRMLKSFYTDVLSMINPPSISTVHAIYQNVLLHNRLTKVLLIKASTTRAQNFNILTEFSFNEAHELFDTINVLSGKQSAMHPTTIHLIKHCRQTQMKKSTNLKPYSQEIKNYFSDIYLAAADEQLAVWTRAALLGNGRVGMAPVFVELLQQMSEGC